MIPRPDLTHIPPAVREYIEALEAEVERLGGKASSRPKPRPAVNFTAPEEEEVPPLPPLAPDEPPTTVNLISMTGNGLAKRTLRHLYGRQRRGGMGIFDLDAPADDPVALLTLAESSQSLLLFTNLARTFRLPVNLIPEEAVRARGQLITAKMTLQEGEHFVAALPDEARGAIALVSQEGFVRYLRHHVFGEYMKPGAAMFDARKCGELASVCRTPGDAELLIVTRRGKGIRFSEKLVPPQGGPGIRLETGDTATAIVSVDEDSRVFLGDAEGRGTIRLMAGFAANKAAGGGGKAIMNSDCLISAATVEEGGEIFLISRLSKIIRFMADETPAKESTVQGVNCMMLRSDEVRALLTTVVV